MALFATTLPKLVGQSKFYLPIHIHQSVHKITVPPMRISRKPGTPPFWTNRAFFSPAEKQWPWGLDTCYYSIAPQSGKDCGAPRGPLVVDSRMLGALVGSYLRPRCRLDGRVRIDVTSQQLSGTEGTKERYTVTLLQTPWNFVICCFVFFPFFFSLFFRICRGNHGCIGRRAGLHVCNPPYSPVR